MKGVSHEHQERLRYPGSRRSMGRRRNVSGIVKLNDTAAIAWRGIEEGLSRDQIVARVVESYDVDEPRAAADVDAFLQTLVKAGIASE